MSTEQPGIIEAAVVDLGRGHLVDVWAEPGAAHFFGELSGCDHDSREPWRMGFWLPRAAVEELSAGAAAADASGHPKPQENRHPKRQESVQQLERV